MRLYVVTKSPVGLDGAAEIVGTFTSRVRAGEACKGAGTYLIAHVALDRAYKSGTLLDVESVVVTGAEALGGVASRVMAEHKAAVDAMMKRHAEEIANLVKSLAPRGE